MDKTDPVTGRNFDGRYDDELPCGCVNFYHGGVAPCEEHREKEDGGWRVAFRDGHTKW